MKIRKLEEKDAPFMLEWMHDESVTRDLRTDFKNKTIVDCNSFINISKSASDNCHMAIVDEDDEYMGTVSLKHFYNGSAEFGITVRSCAMGNGYSSFGMQNIINYGFNELGLQQIYWCVDPANTRALRFYDKNEYCRIPYETIIGILSQIGCYSSEEIHKYVWYRTCK